MGIIAELASEAQRIAEETVATDVDDLGEQLAVARLRVQGFPGEAALIEHLLDVEDALFPRLDPVAARRALDAAASIVGAGSPGSAEGAVLALLDLIGRGITHVARRRHHSVWG